MYVTVHKRKIFDLIPMTIGVGIAKHSAGELFRLAEQRSRNIHRVIGSTERNLIVATRGGVRHCPVTQLSVVAFKFLQRYRRQ
jgi:hypothetical protein